jgi:transcriptional regulator with XRE-family HTH domain
MLEEKPGATMSTKSPNAVDIYVGSRVKMQRIVAGFSQEHLAALIGVTFQQVQKYEKGINRIGASRLQLIAQVLGAPIGFFFKQDEDQLDSLAGIEVSSEVRMLAGMMLTKEGIALNRAFLKIKNPKTRSAIVILAKTLAADGEESILDSSDEALLNTAFMN